MFLIDATKTRYTRNFLIVFFSYVSACAHGLQDVRRDSLARILDDMGIDRDNATASIRLVQAHVATVLRYRSPIIKEALLVNLKKVRRVLAGQAKDSVSASFDCVKVRSHCYFNIIDAGHFS